MVSTPVAPVPPEKGAAVAWWMYQVSKRLHLFEPHIVAIKGHNQEMEEFQNPIHFHRVHFGRAYKRCFQKITRLDPLSYGHRVARIIERVRPDIVHVHNAPELVSKLRRLVKWPVPCWLHHMHNPLAMMDVNPETKLIVVSEFLKQWYQKNYPFLNPTVVTNGADLDLLCRPRGRDSSTDALRLRFGIPDNRKVLLYVGRISPEKGALELVKAFQALLRLRQDVFLLLVGEMRFGGNSDRRAVYGNEVRSLSQSMVGYCQLAGVVPPDEVPNYYRLGDLLVVPSQCEETFGLVAIESMAAGTAVLAVRKGGLPELVIPHQTGFFIDDTGDSEQFALQMSTLLDKPQLLANVAAQAQEYALMHHGWDTVSRQLEAVCLREMNR